MTPTACFTADKSIVKPGEIVNFTNCSQNYTRAEWAFGDGGSATVSDPSYRFVLAGAYTVKLKTFNDVNWQEATKNIIVSNEIRVNYDATYTSSGLNPSDLVSSSVYYAKQNSNDFVAFHTSSGYFKEGKEGALLKSSFVSNGSDVVRIKLVVKVYRGYKSPQSMLPDILHATDSLVTDEFSPLGTTGGAAASVKALNMLTASQSLYTTY